MSTQAVLKVFAGRRALLVVAAAVAAVVVLVISTRYAGGGHRGDMAQVRTSRTPAVTASSPAANTARRADPTTPAADDGDDGVAETPAISITITDGPVDPGEAGMQFLAKWLNTFAKTPAQWRESLHPLVTAQLWDLLADADPATVPEGKLIGFPHVTPGGDLMAVVSVRINRGAHAEIPNGTVTVTMTARTHRWLAAQVDWTVTP